MADPDTSKPNLVNLVLPLTVDVTGGVANALFSVGANDTGSGVYQVYVLFDRYFNGGPTRTNILAFYDTTDSFADGVSRLSQSFGSDTAAGNYNVTSVQVYDNAGNVRIYSAGEVAALGGSTSFTVKSNTSEDIAKPNLASLVLPSNVDVTGGSAIAQFSVGANDAGSGVYQAYVVLDRYINSGPARTNILAFYDSTDSFSDGMSKLSQTFGMDTAAGTYNVTSVQVYDNAGNVRVYSAAEVAAIGGQTAFTVKSNTVEDFVKPTLTGLSLQPVIDVTSGSVAAQFSASAEDVGSGVHQAYVLFDRYFSTGPTRTNILAFYNSTESFADDKSILSKIIGNDTAAGTYTVTSVQVYDNAGNVRIYSASEVTALGGQTSIQVIDRNATVTASVTAPTSVAEGNGTNFSLGLTLQNVTTATTAMTMSFVAGQSTATNGLDVNVPDFSGSYSVSQSPAGNYVIALPSIGVFDDLVAEGTETITIRIQASGQVFDSGTDSTLVTISLLDNDLVGTAINDTLTGTALREHLFGLAGDDVLTGGAGADTLAGGTGADTFRDTAAGLNGDTVTDFALGDRIVVSDATLSNFGFSISGETLSYSGGTLTLTGGVPLGYRLGAAAVATGGVALALEANALTLTQAGARLTNDITLRGSPGLRIAATDVSVTNSAAGRIVGDGSSPAITIDATGSVITNASGGVIRTEADYSGIAIRGSSGSDTVINAGLIAGGIDLQGGADTFVFRASGSASNINLGAGADTFQYEGSLTAQPVVDGGEGLDTVIVDTVSGATGTSWTGFERLVLRGGINIVGFSGYQSISLATSYTNMQSSNNPLVDLALDNQSISLSGSTLRSVVGGANADNLTLGSRAVVGNVSLGAGNDNFNVELLNPGTTPVFGAVEGGAGTDNIGIGLGEGQTLTLDLARVTGFETLSANAGFSYATTINLSNVVAPVSILAGSKANLTLDSSSTALLRGGFGGSIVLNAGVVVGRYGMPTDGPYDSSVDLVQGDDRLSVNLVNHAIIQGDIRFYIGDDIYDGRDGTIGGTIYGNAGNDTLLGGAGVERMSGGAGGDALSGGGGDDVLSGGAGADTLTGGAGADLFLDTVTGLSGDTITDFGQADRIVIGDARLAGFQFSISGTTLSYTGGTLTLAGGVPAGLRFTATTAASGGVELSLIAAPAKAVQGDVNGDGRSDVVWRNDNGALTDWLGQASGGFALNDAAAYTVVPLAWKVAGVGDFNGDGRNDIVWRNDNGALTNWLGQVNGGFAINDTAAYAQISLDWKVAGIGDFNGDGRSDVLWRNDNGALTDWLGQANGGFAINNAAYTTAPTSWKVAGVGDFNGDGRDDVLWRNDNGALTDWLGQANGGFALNDAAAYTTVPTGWRVAGVGDFNGDGRDDVLWRNDNGALTDWLGQANGGFVLNDAAAFATVPTSWKVAGVGDYNGDGRDDILWRNDNGALTDWLGRPNGGFVLNDAAAFTTVPTAWKVADTRPLLVAAATGGTDDGIAALRTAFAPEHVAIGDVAIIDFAPSQFDHTAPLMETIW